MLQKKVTISTEVPYRRWTRGMWKAACYSAFERNVFIMAEQKR